MTSSWFSVGALTELATQVESAASSAVTDLATAATEVASAASDAVAGAAPGGGAEEILRRLALNTDAMVAERERLGEEDGRRRRAAEEMGRLLPWETDDETRTILSEECRTRVLALARDPDTFTTPLPLPGHGHGHAEVAAAAAAAEGEGEEEEEGAAAPPAQAPSGGAFLDPLPPLLEEFDLDAHVGLIGRMLELDPALVDAHANLSGAGVRERIFWRNYFCHCALARDGCGLSVDEIWGDERRRGTGSGGAGAGAGTGTAPGVAEAEAAAAAAHPAAAPPPPGTEEETVTFDHPDQAGGASTRTPAPRSSGSSHLSFELVPPPAGGGGGGGGGGDDDDDLDDLEAEIARELAED